MSTSVTIVNVNSLQTTYQSLGMGSLPAGISASSATKAIETALTSLVTSKWPTTWPALISSQTDQGVMGPWNANVAGTAPPCLVQQITMDFSNWELPSDANAINSMAEEITEQISANGGVSGTFCGRSIVGGSETIYWSVGFGTGAITETPEELGVIYVFTAVLGIN